MLQVLAGQIGGFNRLLLQVGFVIIPQVLYLQIYVIVATNF